MFYCVGGCQNYGPFLGPDYNTGPNLGDPKRDHNFDNRPCGVGGREGKGGEASRREWEDRQNRQAWHQQFSYPSAPSRLNSRLLGYVTIG